MSGLSGLSGLSALSGSGGGGGGVSYDPGVEYQLITPDDAVGQWFFETPATSLFTGGTKLIDATAGALSASELQDELEDLYGVDQVEVTAVTGGFQLKFVDDLDGFDLAQLVVTPSTSYVPNSGAGTNPSKTSQRDYEAGSYETSVINLLSSAPETDSDQNDSAGNTVSYVGATTTYSAVAASGWSVSSGLGTDTVTFTADTTGAKGTTLILSPSNVSPTPVTITPGTPEIFAQIVINLGSGAAGWFTYSAADVDDGIVIIPVTATEAEIDDLIVASASGYGPVTVTKVGSTLTIDLENPAISPATVTVGGRTGAAKTLAVTTLQDGAEEVPGPTPDFRIRSSVGVYQDTPGSVASGVGDPIREAANSGEVGGVVTAPNDSSRPSRNANGFSFDGSDDYLSGTSIDVSGQRVTYRAKIKLSSVSGRNSIIANRETFLCANGTDLQWFSNTVAGAVSFAAGFLVDTEYRVAVRQETDNTYSFAIDGVIVAGGSMTPLSNVDNPLTVGRYNQANVWHCNGLLEDVRVYLDPISDAELEAMTAGDG